MLAGVSRTVFALVLALVLAPPVVACSSAPAGSLEVRMGSRAETLSAARIAELPQVEVEVRGQRFTGARLREVLLMAEVLAGVEVEAVGVDGYKQRLVAEMVGRDDTIVAISAAEDGPLRLIVPGAPGLSVKRLVALRAAPAAVP